MLERLLQRLTRTFNSYRIPYMIIGGQAVLYYGFPRLTQDVDVTLGVDTDAYAMVRSACHRAGLKPLVKQPETFVRKTHVLPTADPKSGLRVDLIFSNTPYERQAIHRARRVRIGDTTVKFASLEDLVIHKLVAGRAVDLEDVRILMLKHQDKINARYIRRWLKEFAALRTLVTNPLTTFDQLRREVA